MSSAFHSESAQNEIRVRYLCMVSWRYYLSTIKKPKFHHFKTTRLPHLPVTVLGSFQSYCFAGTFDMVTSAFIAQLNEFKRLIFKGKKLIIKSLENILSKLPQLLIYTIILPNKTYDIFASLHFLIKL